jgi:hypothetical protein
LLDTSKPTSTNPLYLTYLADVECQIFGIRADKDGNAYVVGTSSSPEFPHQSSFTIPGDHTSKDNGFVAVLNPSGSSLRWAVLLKNVDVTDLALDQANNVYVTGKTGAGAFLTELADNGTKLPYTGRLSPGDPRAIAVADDGAWAVVEGESRLSALMLEPCAKGKALTNSLPQGENSVGTEISSRLALDAFARAFTPPSCHSTQ